MSKYIRYIVVCSCVTIFSPSAHADPVALTASVGSDFFDTHGKNFQVGVAKPFQRTNNIFLINGVFGALNDDNIFGKEFYFYFEANVKLRIKIKPGIYVSANQGIALFTEIPWRLSSHWQLPTGMAVGLFNQHGNYLGLSFKHFSNGTINPKNEGKEYLGVEFGFDL